MTKTSQSTNNGFGKAAAIRDARSFHRLPPETRGLPSTLADTSIVFEVLGDADDSIRMDIANALSVTESRALVERAIPIVLCGFARKRTPLTRSAAAFFALANVVNHLRAPIDARLFADG